MSAVVLPTAVGLGVGIRLIYLGGERRGLRAGGNSRIDVLENDVIIGRAGERIWVEERKQESE